MNIKTLTNDELIDDTERAVGTETRATGEVIRRLREIYERQLYLELGYPTLFAMATKHFGYDRSPAQQRVNAVLLIGLDPSVQRRLDEGSMSLTVAADVQSFLNIESAEKRPYSKAQVATLVNECAGKSVREVQRELASRNPKVNFKETRKFIASDRIQVTYSISVELEEKLERLKALFSHALPRMTHEQLIEKLADLALEKVDPVRRAERLGTQRKVRRSKIGTPMAFKEEIVSAAGEVQLAVDFSAVGLSAPIGSAASDTAVNSSKSFPAPGIGRKRSRYISKKTSHVVASANANTGCEYTDLKSGRRCGSHYFLQRDHIKPWSLGGGNEHENLRLLCGAHNRFVWKRFKSSAVRDKASRYVG